MRKKDKTAETLSLSLDGAGPKEIAGAAIAEFSPKKIFVGFSGGFDSLVAAHWCMNSIPGCEVFHIDTGIGVKATRDYVEQICRDNGWPLTVIRAKEDCGQDYDEIVKEFGFPGPAGHTMMFTRLKERATEKLLRDNKAVRADNVMLITGIRQDESARRSKYQSSTISFRGNLLWVSAFYYRSIDWFGAYVKEHSLKRNPVSEMLGMSGECLCGAFAHAGEKALIKMVCPETHARIEALEAEVVANGHSWGWEESPPKKRADEKTDDMFNVFPMCAGCGK